MSAAGAADGQQFPAAHGPPAGLDARIVRPHVAVTGSGPGYSWGEDEATRIEASKDSDRSFQRPG